MEQGIVLTEDQKKALKKLWFIYGNYGKKSTHCNHGYIQGFLEHGEDRKQFYLDGVQAMRDKHIPESEIQKRAITQECIDAVEAILNSKEA